MEQKKFQKAVIVGAGHGIGLFTKNLLEREPSIKIFATYRDTAKAGDLLESKTKSRQSK